MRASPQEVLARDAQRSCLCFQSQWDTALLSHSVLSHINVWYMHAASRLFSWSIELLIAASPHAAPKIEHGHLSVSRFAAVFLERGALNIHIARTTRVLTPTVLPCGVFVLYQVLRAGSSDTRKICSSNFVSCFWELEYEFLAGLFFVAIATNAQVIFF